MVIIDQKWRNLMYKPNDTITDDFAGKMMQQTDSLNYYKLKQIVQKFGCPNTKTIGNEGVKNFWLLIQHQDQHVKFQKKVLKLIKKEMNMGLFNKYWYAYLLDRVKVNTNKKQVYGTQMILNADSTSYIPQPCVNPDKLDERRKKMGLTPEGEYIKTMNEHYKSTLKKENNS